MADIDDKTLDDLWMGSAPGRGKYVPPEDILNYVFPIETRKRWSAKQSENIKWRLNVLSACGPYPEDKLLANKIRYWRCQKSAWEAYLSTAFACGMLNEDERGKDMIARLRHISEADFRSAMAECLACWFLAGKMQFPLDPIAKGRNRRNLDMRVCVEGVEVGVEVKSPFQASPSSGCWIGDESPKITQSIDSANKQFCDDCPNVLILVPHLRVPMYVCPEDLLRAAYGSSCIHLPLNPNSGDIGEAHSKFVAHGKFLNVGVPNGKTFRDDGSPRFRRISTIISIEEVVAKKYPLPRIDELINQENVGVAASRAFEKEFCLYYSSRNRAWIEHEVFVLNNPFAHFPISESVWRDHLQVVFPGGVMKWSDGRIIKL